MIQQQTGSVPHLAPRLLGVPDAEGKLPRALEALGLGAGRRVALLDLAEAPSLPIVTATGVEPIVVPLASPLRIPADDASLDAVVTLWTGFRGVDPADQAEVDRVLRPGGRLLVVHGYGRDDVSGLFDPAAPEYRLWSRREGPFLRGGGFKIRVVHCFWTFPSIEEAQAALAEVFGERGTEVGARMKRPRLSWNVAVYHRWRGGIGPDADQAGGGAERA